jgi:hypothetical protein
MFEQQTGKSFSDPRQKVRGLVRARRKAVQRDLSSSGLATPLTELDQVLDVWIAHEDALNEEERQRKMPLQQRAAEAQAMSALRDSLLQSRKHRCEDGLESPANANSERSSSPSSSTSRMTATKRRRQVMEEGRDRRNENVVSAMGNVGAEMANAMRESASLLADPLAQQQRDLSEVK